MRIASVRHDKRATFGIVTGTGIVDLGGRLGDRYRTLRSLLASGRLTELSAPHASSPADFSLSEVAFLPTVADPGKVVGIGLNYRDHIVETENETPENPRSFLKDIGAFVGHEGQLVRPRVSEQFDYEAELAIVIGKRGRYVPRGNALDYVAGYTCLHDGSIRDYQKHAINAGKNFPASSSMGPWMVTADEISDPGRLDIIARLNGVEVQHSSTSKLIYDIPYLISYVSEWTELLPGDVIATGTPEGVGARRKPPLWLKAGDLFEVEIEGIGVLRNPVVDEVA